MRFINFHTPAVTRMSKMKRVISRKKKTMFSFGFSKRRPTSFMWASADVKNNLFGNDIEEENTRVFPYPPLSYFVCLNDLLP